MADKFRRASVPRHVRIYHRQLQSVAWRHLSGSAVKVLLTMASLEKGENNGEFFLSARKGAELTGLGKNAVNRALHELQDKGFVYCSQPGGFSRKTPHAASWGLTWAAGPKGSEHRAPSHAYEKWRPPAFRGPRKRVTAVPESETVGGKQARDCPENGDSGKAETAENYESAAVSKAGTHTSYQAQEAAEPARDNPMKRPNQSHPNPTHLGWWQPDWSHAFARRAYAETLAGRLREAIAKRSLAA